MELLSYLVMVGNKNDQSGVICSGIMFYYLSQFILRLS
jgi:hypothetical protein